MSFFKRRKTASSPNPPAAINPLVEGLVSNHEPTYLHALQEAVSLSDGGDFEGVRALREAIRIRSGKESVVFYQPGVRRGLMADEMNRYAQAKENILKLAKKRSLLNDPSVSGDYVAALMFSLSGAELQNLLMEIFRVGGPASGYEFQLIFNELRCSARWKEGL